MSEGFVSRKFDRCFVLATIALLMSICVNLGRFPDLAVASMLRFTNIEKLTTTKIDINVYYIISPIVLFLLHLIFYVICRFKNSKMAKIVILGSLIVLLIDIAHLLLPSKLLPSNAYIGIYDFRSLIVFLTACVFNLLFPLTISILYACAGFEILKQQKCKALEK